MRENIFIVKMSLVPKKVFFTKGIGYHKSKLVSLEQALRAAGIEKFNLVKVTSILPPYCIEISKEDGLRELNPGQIVYAVFSIINSNKPNQLICASLGVAKPTDERSYGYLSEQNAVDVTPEEVGIFAEDLATEMLATALGMPFNPDADFDEKREVFKLEGKVIETKNVTEFTTVMEDGKWASVISAAIFIV